MTIRAYKPTDFYELKRLHELYFAKEFNLPDFLRYICVFIVEDDEGIITMGGIRNIAECVLVTNMGRSPLDRASGLRQMLEANSFVADKSGYDQIYVWSQNPLYTKRLIRTGFKRPKGESLIFDL